MTLLQWEEEAAIGKQVYRAGNTAAAAVVDDLSEVLFPFFWSCHWLLLPLPQPALTTERKRGKEI
jgi:hypothetical protein